MRRCSLAVVALLGCQPKPGVVDRGHDIDPPDPLTAGPSPELTAAMAQSRVGVTDPQLGNLLHGHWSEHLRERPRFATSLGVRDYDDRLGRVGFGEKKQQLRRNLLERARAIDPQSLTPGDRVTLQLFIRSMDSDLRRVQCRFDEWNISAHGNPLDDYGELGKDFPIRGQGDADNLLRRYRAVPDAIDGHTMLVRRGLADGLVGNAESLRRVVEMFDRQLAQPVEDWPLLKILERLPEDLPRRKATAEAFTYIVKEQIAPALARYRNAVRDEVLPKARSDQNVGLVALPLGRACYEARVQHYTTLPLTPQEVHDIGLSEIERLDAEIAQLGNKALGTKSLEETLQRLRTDRALYFDTSEEVEAAADEALALAKKKMPDFFGRLPKADCVVERVPDYKAPFTTIAYYDDPNVDGSTPGRYYINVFEPQTRPRFEARVLAVHESIPGHHLQIAIAQELGELPAFRRHEGYTAFVEGWALYTERLADEMGMYDSDLDRLGMLSFDAWRAGRLVVDTGIHALGWSRQDAIDFLMKHTALTPGNIDNEVDRYISWPGQALGYKIGQLEIWKLRRQAEAKMGERFELAGFHDAVLTGGAVTLPVLQQQVAAYVEGT